MRRRLLAAVKTLVVLAGLGHWALHSPRDRGSSSDAGEQARAGAQLSRVVRTAAPWVALAILAAGVAGFVVVASGVVPIKASSRHWAITAWFLKFAKERSVATHTLGIRTPPLDDDALVLKGAGHYDFGCQPCHGSPSSNQPPIAAAMTPRPPDLRMTAPRYEPAELFYIVKHGVKFTGMPAWPAPTRDDEVWAMVAFLRRLPGLEPEAYRQLVPRQGRLDAAAMPLEDLSGPTAALSPLVERCAVCHGADGLGRGAGAFPRIAGQRRQYLLNALQAYARGDRHSGLMQPVAQGLRPAETALLADYFSRLPSGHVAAAGPHASAAADPAAVERGARIAQRGIPERGVPACLECHGPRSGPINPAYPLLDGQYRAYLELQLRLFRADQRGGSPFAHLMRRVAATLPPESIPDVAAYYAARQAGID